MADSTEASGDSQRGQDVAAAATRAPNRIVGAGAAGALVLILIGVGVWGAVLVRDLLEVRQSLAQARDGLRVVGAALGDVDLDEALPALDAAEDHLEQARSRTETVRWSLATWAPIARHPIVVTRDVVETASAAIDLVHVGLDEGGDLVEGGLRISVRDGQLDLDPLLRARDVLHELPLERLVSAHAELADPPGGWVPQELADGRNETLALAAATIETVTRARAASGALPGFLGADGPRRYFVGMQTSAELRGTGGLIGYWLVLEVDDGRFDFSESEVFEGGDELEPDGVPSSIARAGALRGGEGVDAGPAFLDRYGRFGANSTFSNVNLDPNLPTTAPVILDLFELRTGEALDGVILLDPVGLERLLVAAGSTLSVPDQVSEALDLEGEVPTNRFAELVSVHVYDVLGSEHGSERKATLSSLGDAAIAQLFDGRWDGVEMARAVVEAGRGRHLQVFSADMEEPDAFTQVGATGALEVPPDTDLVAVTANNAVGGKQDVHVGHSVSIRVQLTDIAREGDVVTAGRRSTVAVQVDNPLPSEGMDEYILGNCIRDDGTVGCFEGPPGWNQTWFTVWLPGTTHVVAAGEDDGRRTSVSTHRGMTVADRFHPTPPASTSSFEIHAEGRVPIDTTSTTAAYRLIWWRQAKGIPDLLDVQIAPPSGWAIVDVTVEGGGDGRGFGPHGVGVDLVAVVDGEGARVSGTVNADTRIDVHLAPRSS